MMVAKESHDTGSHLVHVGSLLCFLSETDSGDDKQVKPDILGPSCTYVGKGSYLPLIGVLKQVHQALGLEREEGRWQQGRWQQGESEERKEDM